MKQDSADKARSGTGKWKQIEEELRELNASKDKFFSIISHDLRNPVTFIVGFSELLLKDLETLSEEEIKLYVTNIHRSAKNLYDLLENLLQWAELQRGRVDYQPVKVDLREIVEANVNLLHGNASEKDIDLSYELDEDCVVYADRYMLNSVIQNLISNAIKFTHLKGTVEITARRQDKSVEVSIIDTGTGMSDEQLASLFQMD
jgi:signal transduction histidine kinase